MKKFHSIPFIGSMCPSSGQTGFSVWVHTSKLHTVLRYIQVLSWVDSMGNKLMV
jgi:hypothetical protein